MNIYMYFNIMRRRLHVPAAATSSPRSSNKSFPRRRRQDALTPREKTLGKDALKQKKEIGDTTQRKAKQGDKEYVHNYGPVDRVKKRQRDADYYEAARR